MQEDRRKKRQIVKEWNKSIFEYGFKWYNGERVNEKNKRNDRRKK